MKKPSLSQRLEAAINEIAEVTNLPAADIYKALEPVIFISSK